MKTLIISFLLIFTFSFNVIAASKYIPAEPIIEARDCVLQLIAPKMNTTIDPLKEKPRIRPETNTPLKDYQDSIEKFWGFRPDVFVNVFNPLQNEIFIMSQRHYYESKNRSVYDSLAHELVHYIQHSYHGADFTVGDDSLEMQAIDVQTWFRDTYRNQFVGDQFICP